MLCAYGFLSVVEQTMLCDFMLTHTHEAVHDEKDIQVLYTHGIALIVAIIEPSPTLLSDVQSLFSQLVSHFITHLNATIVILCQVSCAFLLSSFPDEVQF